MDVGFWRSFFDQSEAMTKEALQRVEVLWEVSKVVAKANKTRMRKPKSDGDAQQIRFMLEAMAVSG